MNITQLMKTSRSFMKRSALGLAIGAVAILGTGLTAQAATTTSVISFDNLSISPGQKISKIAKGALPVGSILRSVSINANKVDGWAYTDEICVWIAESGSSPSGILRIVNPADGNAPGASTTLNWNWSGSGYDNPIISTQAGVPAIDLNSYAVFLDCDYWGTWTGTITLTYDEPADPNTLKDILTFNFGALGDATITGTNITKIVPSGTAVTALSPTYTINGASCAPLSPPASPLDFTSPVTYTVTATNLSTKTYIVRVTVSSLPVASGLVVHLKADAVDIGNVNQIRSSGSDLFVKQWNDQTGNGHNATNITTEADQPKYIANALNGKPVIRFSQRDESNGSRLYLGDLSASFPTAGSVFVVSTINNDGRYNLFGNSGQDDRWVADTWSESRPTTFRKDRADGSVFSYSSWPHSGSHVFALESSSSLYRFLIDGTQIGSTGGDYNSGSGQNWTIGNRKQRGDDQQLNGDIPELIIYNRILTTEEAQKVGGYLAAKYALTTSYPTAPEAKILTFGPGASVNGGANTVAWTVPFGTDVTALAPTYTLSADATCTPAYGSTNDFTSPVTYRVVSSDNLVTTEYTVTVTVAAPSSAKDIITFSFGDFGDAVISGTSITKTVPMGTSLVSLAPTYTVSPDASGSPVSGTARNFKTPQTYQVTAQDGTTQDFTVTVTKSSSGRLLTMVVNARNGGVPSSPVSGPAGSTPYWNYPSPAITDNGQTATKANMVDSTGAGTGIGFSIRMPSNDPWGNPALEMLKTGLFNPGWGDWGQCEINGLTVGGIYNLFIASARINDNERSKGTFRMLNVADKATADVDCSKDPVTGETYPNNNGGPRNGSTWVEGNNYVAFRNVIANSDGKILFTANENCAPHLLINGFQLQEIIVEPPAPTLIMFF